MLLGVGILYLSQYQQRLIATEAEALASEARLFAAAVAEGAVVRDAEETYLVSPGPARQMLRRLYVATRTRTRLFDANGLLVADTHLLMGSGSLVQVEELPAPPQPRGVLERALDRAGALLEALPGRPAFPAFPYLASDTASVPDARKALEGEVSATVWSTPSGGLMFTAGAPVQRLRQVLGSVVLYRSGATVDQALRSVRLDVLRIFGVCLAVTIGFSIYLAGTIARPIRRLAAAAEAMRLGSGRAQLIPDFRSRGDEIGDLSHVLRELTAALWSRMDATERFAADVAHEIKNPLTSLKSAVETAARLQDPEKQRRLMTIIQDDVERLDRLISDISNASRIDAEMSRIEAAPVDLCQMLRLLAEVHNEAHGIEPGRASPVPAVVATCPGTLPVAGIASRLTQVFQNLVGNAVSFSPPGGTVRIDAVREGALAVVRVDDDGPGIEDGALEKIFERFYSSRPADEKFGTHSGLGLSICKQIVEAHGGTIAAENRVGERGVEGARFTVRLPAL